VACDSAVGGLPVINIVLKISEDGKLRLKQPSISSAAARTLPDEAQIISFEHSNRFRLLADDRAMLNAQNCCLNAQRHCILKFTGVRNRSWLHSFTYALPDEASAGRLH